MKKSLLINSNIVRVSGAIQRFISKHSDLQIHHSHNGEQMFSFDTSVDFAIVHRRILPGSSLWDVYGFDFERIPLRYLDLEGEVKPTIYIVSQGHDHRFFRIRRNEDYCQLEEQIEEALWAPLHHLMWEKALELVRQEA